MSSVLDLDQFSAATMGKAAIALQAVEDAEKWRDRTGDRLPESVYIGVSVTLVSNPPEQLKRAIEQHLLAKMPKIIDDVIESLRIEASGALMTAGIGT